MVEDHVRCKDAYITRLIRRKARSMCRLHGFSPSDFRDIQQDLWLHLLHQQARFNPRVAAFETFANRLITNKARSMVRHRRAQKRDPANEAFSLQQTMCDADGVELPHSETLADHTFPSPHHGDLRLDVDTFVDRLGPGDRHVAEALREGRSQSQIATTLGVSRRQITNAVTRIQRLAREFELHEYLGDPSPAHT